MRWIVVALLVFRITSARADMLVIEEPGLYYACPKGKTWETVAKCLRTQGRADIVKTVAGGKLVRLDQNEGGKWIDAGVYLYVEDKAGWHIAGMFAGGGTDYELLEFEHLVVGKHTGFRIDIGQASPMFVQLDGLTSSHALRRASMTMFCGGVNNYCLVVTKSCEVLVHGNAYWTFRGAMTINGNEVTVKGDRSYAGPFCTQAERVFLGWPSG